MRYFEYKRYGYKLKIYKLIAIVIGLGAVFLYLKLRSMGFSDQQLIHFIYAVCITVIVILVGIRIGSKAIKKRKYLNSPLAAVDHMSGEDFEKYLAAHFRKLGYRVRLTAGSGDFGADLVCKKNHETIVVQAKRYKKSVGIEAIQQIVASKAYYKADKCMVVTNSYFTKAAIKLAESNHVQLWDRHSINKFFINHEDKDGVKHEREASIENTG
ncbi:MAG: restriction endonuclease [Butyrivibrio sp.]|nr:restriction endonuclease [Butyrivibrio sp.]